MSPVPSPRAAKPSTASEQLAEKIVECIQEEHQRNPALTPNDVHHALRLAKTFMASQFGQSPYILRYVVLGAAILLGLLASSLTFFFISR